MTKALKVVMIIFGVIMIIMGLMNLIMPEQVADMHGVAEISGYVKWLSAIAGVCFIAAGVWVVVAGRDPLRNIYWVKFLITLLIIALIANIYAIGQGYVEFSQVVQHIIMDVVFAAALLALYPWRAARFSE
jgi:hypothetical protein